MVAAADSPFFAPAIVAVPEARAVTTGGSSVDSSTMVGSLEVSGTSQLWL
jgi:hypothetical protein